MTTKTKGTRKEEIYQQAALLFKEKGFEAASMRDIADRVGIKAASLYNHIRTKHELLKAICFDVANRYVEQMEAVSQEPISSSDKIERLIRLHVRMATDDTAAANITNYEWKHLLPADLEDFKAIRRHYETGFQKLIEEGIEKGEFVAVNSKVALFTILSAVRWIGFWYREDRPIVPEALSTDIVTILMRGLQR